MWNVYNHTVTSCWKSVEHIKKYRGKHWIYMCIQFVHFFLPNYNLAFGSECMKLEYCMATLRDLIFARNDCIYCFYCSSLWDDCDLDLNVRTLVNPVLYENHITVLLGRTNLLTWRTITGWVLCITDFPYRKKSAFSELAMDKILLVYSKQPRYLSLRGQK